MWRLTVVLTRIWTTEPPLSCSGIPEGRRCLLCRFSFFSGFLLPLRFCLRLCFFLGVSGPDELLGSWTEAAVGHTTLLFSEKTLMPKKRANNVNSRHTVSIASANKHEVWRASSAVNWGRTCWWSRWEREGMNAQNKTGWTPGSPGFHLRGAVFVLSSLV